MSFIVYICVHKYTSIYIYIHIGVEHRTDRVGAKEAGEETE